MPAIRLPSVCWAARPKTTAVIAPPTASVARVQPRDPQRDQRRDDEEHQPDQEARPCPRSRDPSAGTARAP